MEKEFHSFVFIQQKQNWILNVILYSCIWLLESLKSKWDSCIYFCFFQIHYFLHPLNHPSIHGFNDQSINHFLNQQLFVIIAVIHLLLLLLLMLVYIMIIIIKNKFRNKINFFWVKQDIFIFSPYAYLHQTKMPNNKLNGSRNQNFIFFPQFRSVNNDDNNLFFSGYRILFFLFFIEKQKKTF
mgnify:CR=1 FL=1